MFLSKGNGIYINEAAPCSSALALVHSPVGLRARNLLGISFPGGQSTGEAQVLPSLGHYLARGRKAPLPLPSTTTWWAHIHLFMSPHRNAVFTSTHTPPPASPVFRGIRSHPRTTEGENKINTNAPKQMSNAPGEQNIVTSTRPLSRAWEK